MPSPRTALASLDPLASQSFLAEVVCEDGQGCICWSRATISKFKSIGVILDVAQGPRVSVLDDDYAAVADGIVGRPLALIDFHVHFPFVVG
jgi:hypothetical protein